MTLGYPLKGIGVVPGIFTTQNFGEHLRDYSQFGLVGHNGWDIAAPKGTLIYAVHDGNIEFYRDSTDYGTGYGKNVRLYFDDGDITWDCVYGHLDRYEGANRPVKRGDIIGYVDSSGYSTGHHLHFGIRKLKDGAVLDYDNGYLGYIDPRPYFREDKMIYKQKGQATLYFGVGTVLIPFATDYAAYLKEFANAVVIELDTPEFLKFKVAEELKVKK